MRAYWVWKYVREDPRSGERGMVVFASGYPEAKRIAQDELKIDDYFSIRAVVLADADKYAEKGYLTDTEALDVGLAVPCGECGVVMLTKDDEPVIDANGHPICSQPMGGGCLLRLPTLDAMSDHSGF